MISTFPSHLILVCSESEPDHAAAPVRHRALQEDQRRQHQEDALEGLLPADSGQPQVRAV